MIVTLAGHVDHGKTAIVKALTGVDTDRLEEEKRRGLTIDLGFAYHDFDGQRVGFVDVPGHHRFIHNMIAGVASMQHALLVVAADDGVMPQTTEHFNILQLLGLTQGTVVINKIDLVDDGRVAEVTNQIRNLTSATFLDSCSIVTTSAIERTGFEELRNQLRDAASRFRRHERSRSIRFSIDRSFSPRGVGAVVTGMVFDGSIETGDDLIIVETGKRVRARNLVVNGLPAQSAQAGDRCGIHLSGESASRITRGMWLRDQRNANPVNDMTVRLRVVPDFPRRVRHWHPVHVYHATSHVQARLLPLERTLHAGNAGLADIATEQSLNVTVGDRIVVRDHDLQRTLGGGVVTSINAKPVRRRSPHRVAAMSKLVPLVERDDFVSAFRLSCTERCIRVHEFLNSWNLPTEVATELEQLSGIRNLNDRVLSFDKLQHTSKGLASILSVFHEEHPSQLGMSLSQLANHLKCDHETVQFVLACGIEDGLFQSRAGKYSLKSHSVDQPTYNKQLFERISPMIDVKQPPTTGDVARALKMPLRMLETELKRMASAKVLVEITPKRYFTKSRVNELAKLALNLNEKHPFTVREFRDESGIGRMPVIDILEYFDRQRFTKRREDVRTVIGPIERATSL
ncbi:MAG: selenocysteine-specific translation elongation factor [Gammaproteobacteria bacterium]|nr:selenocysteine-specific translation elongation factor [Gammaproteobacteria bacterium]